VGNGGDCRIGFPGSKAIRREGAPPTKGKGKGKGKGKRKQAKAQA